MGIVMIATVFAALPTGKAWYVPPVQTKNTYNDNMVEISGYLASADPFYLGQQDRWVSLHLHNTGATTTTGGTTETLNRVMITATSVRGPDGTVTTNAIHWDVNTDDGPTGTGYTIDPNNYQWTINFQFDIDPDVANAPPGTYNITFKIDYEYDHDNDGNDEPASENEYIHFNIGTNIGVSDAHPGLYAGQTFTPLNIDVDDNAWNSAHNLYLNLSNIPTGITFDSPNGWIPGDVGNPSTIGFRVDVERDMAPGVYPVDYQVQYYNGDNVWCTDTGTLNITVEFTPVIEAELTGTNITINQGDAAIQALGVTFTNTGNVDLRDVVIDLDYDGYFFYAATDYYEGSAGSNQQNPVQVTEVDVGSLDIGATAEGQWYVAANPYVQAGDHRILFDWDATYFDNGATNNPTHYEDVSGFWWDDDMDPSTPMVPGYSLLPWQEWIAGAYVMIGVVDNHPDFSASKIENYDTGNDYFNMSSDELTDVEVYSEIHNFELVDFTELKATLQVGAGTPFWNPMDHSATTVDSDMTDSDDTIAADGYADMYWYVDINPNTAPGIYTVNITLTGRNADTTQYITTTMQATVEVRGFGPEIVVTGVTTGDIAPGKIFYLNLTVQNVGDDTARDVFVTIPGNVGYDWNVINGFVSSISSFNNSYYDYADWWSNVYASGENNSRDVQPNDITLKQLNITDAKDIVDLALYIEGVFNSPTPEVWMMKADTLAPGQSVTLSFKMQTNINMVEGRPYVIDVVTDFTDSYGNGPDVNLRTQEITLRTTDPGTPYHTTPTTTQPAGTLSNENLMLLGLILLVIILIIIGVALAGSRSGKKKQKEPEETQYTQEPMPPEGEVAPEEIPPAPGEEEGEPGFELEEKEGETSF